MRNDTYLNVSSRGRNPTDLFRTLEAFLQLTGADYATWVKEEEAQLIIEGAVSRWEMSLSVGTLIPVSQEKQFLLRFQEAIHQTLFEPPWLIAGHMLKAIIRIPFYDKQDNFCGSVWLFAQEKFSSHEASLLQALCSLMSYQLEALALEQNRSRQLLEERQTAILRDKFIAILGHDLRNPIGAILNVAELLMRLPLEERVQRMALIVKNSSLRMKVLTDNLLDFAKGHLGEGIPVHRVSGEPLKDWLQQVVDELRLNHPEISLQVNISCPSNLICDGQRIAQVLGNLLSNAVHHGKEGSQVRVESHCNEAYYSLTVSNEGDAIPPKVQERMFRPFYRGILKPERAKGLGLGLYITAEIARAHEGKMEVYSEGGWNKFTLYLPLPPQNYQRS